MNFKIKAKGTLQYGPGQRALVWVDQNISNYYRSLLPKAWYVQPQMYPAHITVVRTKFESPSNMDAWGKYEGEIIPFEYYTGSVKRDDVYCWIDVWSECIGEIRKELGLPKYRGGSIRDLNSYHITIGNRKDEIGYLASTPN